MKKKAVIKEIVFYASVIVIALLIRYFVGGTMFVQGDSMEGTFQNNDVVVEEKVSYYFSEPKYGDVVIVNDVINPFEVNGKEKKLIKRVIGVPGDTIEVKNGVLLLNGEKVNEPYIKEKMEQDFDKITVKKGTYFVMGDNRNNSLDSRILGSIPKEKIDGRIVLELWGDVFNTSFKVK